MRRQSILMIAVAMVVLLLVAASVAGATGRRDVRVLPPGSQVQGLSYGEWLAQWWEYALTTPATANPLAGTTGTDCTVKRIGRVGLVLANSTMGGTLTCRVPLGTKLFVEVLGAECSTLEQPPFYGADEDELRAAALAFVPEDLAASIDGVAVRDLDRYVVLSPLYTFTVPADNVLGAAAGATGQSVAYGAYLMVAPRSPGHHVLSLHGTYPGLGYTADKTIDVVVERQR